MMITRTDVVGETTTLIDMLAGVRRQIRLVNGILTELQPDLGREAISALVDLGHADVSVDRAQGMVNRLLVNGQSWNL
jgi:hypothetical protein